MNPLCRSLPPDRCGRYEAKRYNDIRIEAHAHPEYLVPSALKQLAECRVRNLDYTGMPNRGIKFMDESMLWAEVKGRNSAEKSSMCVLERILLADGSYRTRIKCDCGYAGRDGFCDHAVHTSEMGGGCHVFELFPVCKRTESWKLQYPLNVEFGVPSIREASAGSAAEVRAELGLSAGGTLLPMVAIGRLKGRPKKQLNMRVSKYTLLQKSSAQRAKVNGLGNLIYVPTDKCSMCQQQGHDARTCRGKGFIKASVDRAVAAIYRQREQDVVEAGYAAAADARLSARMYQNTDPVDHTQDPDVDHSDDEPSAGTNDGDRAPSGGNGDDLRAPGPHIIDDPRPLEIDHDSGDDSDAAADDRCDYRDFYETIGGSIQLRANFTYKKNCRENRTKPVQCAVCMKDHHSLCFKRADQWNNDQDTAGMRGLAKGQSLCWECYEDDEHEYMFDE